VSRPTNRLRAFYGGHPLNLLALIGCFALSGYALSLLAHAPNLERIVLWFAIGVIGHDLALFPLYALADRSLAGLVHRRRTATTLPVINYVRVPALASGLLLVAFAPTILRHSEVLYTQSSGLSEARYFDRWLLLTGAFFLASAVLYAARLAWLRTR
jgi:hypothetical protein